MFIYFACTHFNNNSFVSENFSFVTASEFSILSLVVVAARWTEVSHVLGTQTSTAAELAIGANAASDASAETTQAAPKTTHAAKLAILRNVERV